MQKTKTFIQYSDKDVYIYIDIDINGGVRAKSRISFKKYYKDWHLNNKEKCNKNSKKWNLNNKDRHKELNEIWNKNNPDKIKKYSYKHSRTINGKKIRIKVSSRRRKLGFNPLNEYFEGSHFHHLHINNSNDGYYIPAELHKSIWHSHKDKETMNKINKIVFEWLENQQ